MANKRGRKGAWGRAEKFWDRVDQTGGEQACWPWTGPPASHGYGAASFHGKPTTAVRAAWLHTYGEDSIPPGAWLLHSCDNRSCCNRAHLRLGSPAENTKDMMTRGRSYWAERTHCANDHEFTEENTRVGRRKDGSTYRRCAECRRISGK